MIIEKKLFIFFSIVSSEVYVCKSQKFDFESVKHVIWNYL